MIDAQREAELLEELTTANRGPLSERAVQSVFAAVLDVMKQEVRGESRPDTRRRRRRRRPSSRASPSSAPGSWARRSGWRRSAPACARVTGWDADAATLREAQAKAVDTAAASLREAVAGVELVVVAVPVGALVAATADVLAVAAAETTVTDVGSTKRALAAAVEDPRFVPGHPLAGGATGGPARAAADLFDGATWFLTPLSAHGRRPARPGRALRDHARRARGPAGRRRARPPARAHEPSPPRPRERPDAADRARLGGTRRAARACGRGAARDDARRGRERGRLDGHLRRERRPDRRRRRGAPRRAGGRRARAARAATGPSSSRGSPRPRPPAAACSSTPTAPRRAG